jgi:hypothetical protein
MARIVCPHIEGGLPFNIESSFDQGLERAYEGENQLERLLTTAGRLMS